MLCLPDSGTADARMVRDYFGMHRHEWEDTGEIVFHLPYGEWIRLFRRCGFTVEDLIEIQPPEVWRCGRRRLREPRMGTPLAKRGDLESPTIMRPRILLDGLARPVVAGRDPLRWNGSGPGGE
jgi:hypothetical protein